MNPIKGLLKFFKMRATQRQEEEQIGNRWLEGHEAFRKGVDFYAKERVEEALDCFDEAINCGYVDDTKVYEWRGLCLQSLRFDLDAIDDFDRAIALNPVDCVTFYSRANSKHTAGDLHGSISDYQEAIRLASIDNEYTRSYDAWARGLGYRNCAHHYEMWMEIAKNDLLFREKNSDPAASSYAYFKELFEKKANKRRRPNVPKGARQD